MPPAFLSVEEMREGIPLLVQEVAEIPLVAAVLGLLVIPVYLAHRRRSFRRTLGDG